jgi:hypothetical protein
MSAGSKGIAAPSKKITKVEQIAWLGGNGTNVYEDHAALSFGRDCDATLKVKVTPS